MPHCACLATIARCRSNVGDHSLAEVNRGQTLYRVTDGLPNPIRQRRRTLPPAGRARKAAPPAGAIDSAPFGKENTGAASTCFCRTANSRNWFRGSSNSKTSGERLTNGVSDEKNLHRGCQCGKVRYEAEADIGEVITCNCSRCRKLGPLLSAVAMSDFKLLSGGE